MNETIEKLSKLPASRLHLISCLTISNEDITDIINDIITFYGNDAKLILIEIEYNVYNMKHHFDNDCYKMYNLSIMYTVQSVDYKLCA